MADPVVHPRPARGAVRRQARPIQLGTFASPELAQELLERRTWVRGLDPAAMVGLKHEVRMLHQSVCDAFLLGNDTGVRQHTEALRRLLREQAVVPEMQDMDGEGTLEDGLSADLRRVLRRVGLEMGIDA